MKLPQILLALLVAFPPLAAGQPFYDRKHFSKVFGEERNYRILLPPDYDSSAKRYPVVTTFTDTATATRSRNTTTARTPFPRCRNSWRITTSLSFRWMATWRATTAASTAARPGT